MLEVLSLWIFSGHKHMFTPHITCLSECKTRVFGSDNFVVELSSLEQFDQKSFSKKETGIMQKRPLEWHSKDIKLA